MAPSGKDSCYQSHSRKGACAQPTDALDSSTVSRASLERLRLTPSPPATRSRPMERFIRLWQAAKSLKHAARTLRLTPQEALTRAVLLRLEGRVLKPLDMSPRLFSTWWNAAETVEDLSAMLALSPKSLRRHRFA